MKESECPTCRVIVRRSRLIVMSVDRRCDDCRTRAVVPQTPTPKLRLVGG